MTSRIQLMRHVAKKGLNPFHVLLWLDMRKRLADCRSILDVGCGSTSLVWMLEPERLVGIDGYEPAVDEARRLGSHHEVVLGDIRDLSRSFRNEMFDACLAFDVIEHLPKEEGFELIRAMEGVARRKVIFLTPNGFLPQGNTEAGDLQAHHSGWEPAEMRQLGYKVSGLLGPKSWRGAYHALQKRPRFFWGGLSVFAHALWTKRHPEQAAAIICEKQMAAR